MSLGITAPDPANGQDASIPEFLKGPGKECSTCGTHYPPDFLVCPRDATPLGVTEQRQDPLIGTVVGATYRLKRVLAAGGMGRLYEAEHVRLERRFAVKVLHSCFAHDPSANTRFEREVRAIARIRSDYVVDVVDLLRTVDGRPCIVAELLDGRDLQRRLDRGGPISLREAIRITRHTCRGLAAAHAQGIIHRDLKPSNIFLTRGADGRPVARVLDFGVAKFQGDPGVTKTGAVIGTPAFMSPEQARGHGDVDPAYDIYGVGALLYRMVTGRAPYIASDASSVVAQVLKGPPRRPSELNPSIPSSLEGIILRAMAREPEHRYRTVMNLERDLTRLVEGTTAASTEMSRAATTDTQPTAARPARRWMEQWASLSCMSFLGLEVIAGVTWWALEESPPFGLGARLGLAAIFGVGLMLKRDGERTPHPVARRRRSAPQD